MTILGSIIIGAFSLVFIILVISRVHDSRLFEYREEIFHKEFGSGMFETEKIQEYTHKQQLDKWAKKILEKPSAAYEDDPFDDANRARMVRAYKKVLVPVKEFFGSYENEVYKSKDCDRLQDLVIKCYGNVL